MAKYFLYSLYVQNDFLNKFSFATDIVLHHSFRNDVLPKPVAGREAQRSLRVRFIEVVVAVEFQPRFKRALGRKYEDPRGCPLRTYNRRLSSITQYVIY